MRKKKIAAIAAACVLIAIAAAVVVVIIFARKPGNKQPDITDTPIPAVVDIGAADQPSAQILAYTDALPETQETDSAVLFGQTFRARIQRSETTYESATGLPVPEYRATEYLDTDGRTLYVSTSYRENTVIRDADGTIVYSSGDYTPETDYETDPIHWLYDGGELACGELCFYDDENTGVAYYGADGALLGVRTELLSVDQDGGLQVRTVCYDSSFTEISESDFEALLPSVDEPSFMYIHWS